MAAGGLVCAAELAGAVIDDAAVGAIRHALQLECFPSIALTTVHEAVDHVARERRYHPIREYLDGLAWDGAPRIGYWLSYYLGTEASDYTRLAGRFWLVSVVARVMRTSTRSKTGLLAAS